MLETCTHMTEYEKRGEAERKQVCGSTPFPPDLFNTHKSFVLNTVTYVNKSRRAKEGMLGKLRVTSKAVQERNIRLATSFLYIVYHRCCFTCGPFVCCI